MKLSLCIAALFAVDTVNGFTFVAPSRAPMKLFSEEATDVVDEVDAPPAAPAFKAGFKKGQLNMINKKIAGADAAGFGSVAKEVEDLITEAAGRNFLAKARKRLNNRAKELGVSFDPKEFASSAPAEKARKEKQDAFVKAKIED
ncbi:hypothetical protein TrRE_jg8404 [Triparma retinervis]|uniref:Uncharacterized protein n=1 Tax=Triparma retinervis TaxID=2557542 RepID=A0A9W6Z9U4_9STRA|nr:hypothetical protein TrRE_jg8404 [Triparma retinervis]